jgi:Protein of unknown function (DUF2934)
MGSRVVAEGEYRYAFEEFSKQVRCVQSLAAAPGTDRKAFETALVELEKAHWAYNQARDTFVQSLLPASAKVPEQRGADYASDVQTIAELLWEGAGRPSGTAEEDWLRAEAIVKSALAETTCAGV